MSGSRITWPALFWSAVCFFGPPVLIHANNPVGPQRVALADANVELDQPEGCTWRKLEQSLPSGLQAFACANQEKHLGLVLVVDNHDYRETGEAAYMTSVRTGLERGARKLNGTVASFEYQKADFASDAYRLVAEYQSPAGTQFMYAYAVVHDRAYLLQAMTPARVEPPVLSRLAKSLKLLQPARPREPSSIGRWINTVEFVAVVAALGYIWYRRQGRAGRLGLGKDDPPVDRGPGVRF